MILWLGTVWNPPTPQYISSLYPVPVGARQPRTPPPPPPLVGGLGSSPCARLYVCEVVPSTLMEWDNLTGSVTLSFLALASHQERMALMEWWIPKWALWGRHRLTPSRKTRTLHHRFYHSRAFGAPCIMWQCTELDWQPRGGGGGNCSGVLNGLTRVRILFSS